MKMYHFSAPNSQGLSKGNRQAAVRNMAFLKAEGFQKGVPDLFVVLPKKLVVIELKRLKGGVVSKEQKHWVAVFNKKTEYAEAHVCRGAEEAIKVIENALLD